MKARDIQIQLNIIWDGFPVSEEIKCLWVGFFGLIQLAVVISTSYIRKGICHILVLYDSLSENGLLDSYAWILGPHW